MLGQALAELLIHPHTTSRWRKIYLTHIYASLSVYLLHSDSDSAPSSILLPPVMPQHSQLVRPERNIMKHVKWLNSESALRLYIIHTGHEPGPLRNTSESLREQKRRLSQETRAALLLEFPAISLTPLPTTAKHTRNHLTCNTKAPLLITLPIRENHLTKDTLHCFPAFFQDPNSRLHLCGQQRWCNACTLLLHWDDTFQQPVGKYVQYIPATDDHARMLASRWITYTVCVCAINYRFT